MRNNACLILNILTTNFIINCQVVIDSHISLLLTPLYCLSITTSLWKFLWKNLWIWTYCTYIPGWNMSITCHCQVPRIGFFYFIVVLLSIMYYFNSPSRCNKSKTYFLFKRRTIATSLSKLKRGQWWISFFQNSLIFAFLWSQHRTQTTSGDNVKAFSFW